MLCNNLFTIYINKIFNLNKIYIQSKLIVLYHMLHILYNYMQVLDNIQ